MLFAPEPTSPDVTTYTIRADYIAALLAECDEKVAMLTALRDQELACPLSERRRNYLVFLDRERSTYAYGSWLLREVKRHAACLPREVAATDDASADRR